MSSHAPLSDRGLETISNLVNSVNDIFVSTVASNRGIDEAAVRATEAGIFTADKAVDVGFADGVATLGEAVSMLEDEIKPSGISFSTGTRLAAHLSSTSNQENAMSDPKQSAASASAPQTNAAVTYTQSQLDNAVAEGRSAAQLDGAKHGEKTGAAAERTRISAIVGSDEAKGRTALAQHLAFETDMQVDAAKKMLAAAAIDKTAPTNALEVAMAALPNPKVGADQAAAGDDAEATVQSILAAGAKFGIGRPRKVA